MMMTQHTLSLTSCIVLVCVYLQYWEVAAHIHLKCEKLTCSSKWCIDCTCAVVFAVDMTFSTTTVLRAVQEVEDTDLLGGWLRVPQSKRREINSHFSSGPQRRKQIIKYWMETDPLASWRSLIVALDEMEEKKAADAIRHLAEPVTGRTGIVHVARGSVQNHAAMLK